jgi:hypothetical protein
MKNFLVILMMLFIVFAASVCWGENSNKINLEQLISYLPKDNKMVYAGKYEISRDEKFYLFYHSKDCNSYDDLKLKIWNGKEIKEKQVFWVVYGPGKSTIIKTAEGTFFFPAAWQRKTGTGMKAALNATIFLQELYFPDEEVEK